MGTLGPGPGKNNGVWTCFALAVKNAKDTSERHRSQYLIWDSLRSKLTVTAHLSATNKPTKGTLPETVHLGHECALVTEYVVKTTHAWLIHLSLWMLKSCFPQDALANRWACPGSWDWASPIPTSSGSSAWRWCPIRQSEAFSELCSSVFLPPLWTLWLSPCLLLPASSSLSLQMNALLTYHGF